MQRQIAGRELKLEGELRVTTTDTFMVSLITPHLASFHRKHPHIIVEIVTTRDVLDLDRRDADVAIRPTRSPESRLTGMRMLDVDFGVYGTPALLNDSREGDCFLRDWIGFDATLRSTRLGAWFDARVPENRVCLRVDSFVVARVAAENGIGLALLPCLLGDSSAHLTKLPIPTDELTNELWLLTHPDLMRSARVNAFIEHFSEAFEST
jgi:DNA-binding transcriptional LysR family regulator